MALWGSGVRISYAPPRERPNALSVFGRFAYRQRGRVSAGMQEGAAAPCHPQRRHVRRQERLQAASAIMFQPCTSCAGTGHGAAFLHVRPFRRGRVFRPRRASRRRTQPKGRPLSGAQFLRVVLTNVRRICDFAGVRTGHGVLLRPVSYAGMAGVTVFYLFSI